MKFRTQKELFEYYASVPYTPKARPPKLSETDSGDEALEKMLIFIPPEHRKYLLWKSNVRQMLFEDDFGDSMLQDDVIYAVLVCRVSTAGDLQDPRSSIDQLAELIELQERDPKFKIIGVCLDFYKNGRKTKGRLIFDEVIDKLYDMKDSGIRPKFNAISFPELARLSRRPSIIFDTAEHCFFFGLRLMRANDRMDLSDPINIGTLANMAAEAQREIYRLGERIARGKKASFYFYVLLLRSITYCLERQYPMTPTIARPWNSSERPPYQSKQSLLTPWLRSALPPLLHKTRAQHFPAIRVQAEVREGGRGSFRIGMLRPGK